MNDKTTIINAAQKFAAKGLIDKAISEWEKLLKDRNDGNIHNTIGDLYLKKGADQAAVKSFNKAAELFRKDGFYPKAIAIYKKVLNIAPNDVDTLIALAKLHAERGLTGNAIDNYHRAAEIYNKEGSTEKAIMIADKMLHLSPTNPGTRSKIAYLYFKLGLRERAANEYASIALDYLKENDVEKAKEFFDKSVEYDPANVSALTGLSTLALRSNNHAQALEALDKALSQSPNNKEVLAAYAKLTLDMGRKDDAKRTLAKLSELDPSSTETKKLLGKAYLEEGLIEKACEELLPVIDNALDAEKWSEAHDLLNNFSGLHTIPVKKRLLRICKAQGDDHTTCNKLKELAALYENEGANEEALQLYREALALNADNTATSEKIKEHEIKLGIVSPALDKESAPIEHANIEAMAVPPAEETVFVKENLLEKLGLQEELETSAETAPEQYSSLEVNTIPDKHGEAMEPAKEYQAITAEQFAAQKAEADFYLQQGLEDEAIKIYKSLLSAFPDNKEIATRLESLNSLDQQPVQMQVEELEKGPSLQTSADDDLQELFAQFEKTEGKPVDYEAHYMAGLDLKQKGLLDQAISEFKVASGDPNKTKRNSTMLALCYMEKKFYPMAIAEFNKIIATMTPDDSTYLHIKYELANAHMNNKEVNRALELYFEIHAQDPDFKDVSARMASLKAKKDQASDIVPKSKRDRVSYI